MFGFLNVNKPVGPTSHDVVLQVRRMIGRSGPASRVKVGHAGTLDPFADGVLVVCLGQATRLAGYVQKQAKRYTAEVTLGATSTTDDPEGEISKVAATNAPTDQQVQEALASFVGEIEQVPPAHSAVHVDGRRSYKIARAGKGPQLQPRQVHINSATLVSYRWPELAIDVRCGAGTYIRALARDIGTKLGVGGYCSRLTRTEVGPFTLADSVQPDGADPARDLIDPMAALPRMAKVQVSQDDAHRIANGNPIECDHPLEEGEVALLDENGLLLAMGEVVGQGRRTIHPTKVLAAGRTG